MCFGWKPQLVGEGAALPLRAVVLTLPAVVLLAHELRPPLVVPALLFAVAVPHLGAVAVSLPAVALSLPALPLLVAVVALHLTVASIL